MASHDHGAQEAHAHEPHGFGVYIVTWLALLALTAVTVVVAGMHAGNLSVFIALLIASVKATIVILWFVHLKEESGLFKVFVFVCFATFAIFIGITFVDILFR